MVGIFGRWVFSVLEVAQSLFFRVLDGPVVSLVCGLSVFSCCVSRLCALFGLVLCVCDGFGLESFVFVAGFVLFCCERNVLCGLMFGLLGSRLSCGFVLGWPSYGPCSSHSLSRFWRFVRLASTKRKR